MDVKVPLSVEDLKITISNNVDTREEWRILRVVFWNIRSVTLLEHGTLHMYIKRLPKWEER